jgi:pseudaminic acid cytidylyltransferase
MNICIIPARGGSKRIPRKNIKPFAGKPMIAYAIDAAKASGLFEHVVVTTDDEEIAGISRERGAETPFMRPLELADDYTPTVPVVAHAIDACQARGWEIDYACCIYPGVPFIQVADLKAGLELLKTTGANYSFPVTEFPSAIQRGLKRGQDALMAPFNPEHEQTRTQDLEPAFYDAGQFYWGTTQAWLMASTRLHSGSAGLVIPQWRVVDIDTNDDWDRAELIYRALREGTLAK